MGFFVRKKKTESKSYDKESKVPVIRASICTGEQVACFRDVHTGHLEEVMLIRTPDDLDTFRKTYGIDGEIQTIY